MIPAPCHMWVKFKFVFGSGLEGFSLGAPVFFPC